MCKQKTSVVLRQMCLHTYSIWRNCSNNDIVTPKTSMLTAFNVHFVMTNLSMSWFEPPSHFTPHTTKLLGGILVSLRCLRFCPSKFWKEYNGMQTHKQLLPWAVVCDQIWQIQYLSKCCIHLFQTKLIWSIWTWYNIVIDITWRHNAMEILLAWRALSVGNLTMTGGFPTQRASKAKLWCFHWCLTTTKTKHNNTLANFKGYAIDVFKPIFSIPHVLNLLVLRPEYCGKTRSIAWLLMPWLFASPGHGQQLYWWCRIKTSLSCMRTDINFQHHSNISTCLCLFDKV